jgi:hypothetical protein
VSELNDLMVVIPCGELGYSRYWQFLLANRDFGYLTFTKRVITQSGAYPHAAANELVKAALGPDVPKWKRLLILEHDHEYPVDVFRKHAGYKEPIVAGSYVLRDIEKPFPVFYNWDTARHNVVNLDAAQLNRMFTKRGLYEVDVVPLGCTSIRRDVLESWPKDQPVFSSFTNPAGSTISHDVFFCRIAQDNGWTLHVDTSLQVKHYVLVPVDDDYFLRWWAAEGAKQAIKRVEEEGAA